MRVLPDELKTTKPFTDMTADQLQTLRNREPLKLWDRTRKMFVQIQINKKDNQVCWERWVSKDRRNWVNWNLYLSLKDVAKVLEDIRRH